MVSSSAICVIAISDDDVGNREIQNRAMGGPWDTNGKASLIESQSDSFRRAINDSASNSV